LERKKPYGNVYFNTSAWNELIEFLNSYFPNAHDISAESWRDSGHWDFDNYSDFLHAMRPDHCFLSLRSSEPIKSEFLTIYGTKKLSFSYASSDRNRIINFELFFDKLVREKTVKRIETESSQIKSKLFIGHGRHSDWRDLKDHLSDKHGIEVVCYESGSRVGHTIRDILDQMLSDSSLAVLIHTPEDELVDGTMTSRPNVIHETGLFQGRLGFPKAILLMKDGVNEFSNVYGVQQIRYSKIQETYGDILAWIKRETAGE
jgi:predicted nucleotide-binding protein